VLTTSFSHDVRQHLLCHVQTDLPRGSQVGHFVNDDVGSHTHSLDYLATAVVHRARLF